MPVSKLKTKLTNLLSKESDSPQEQPSDMPYNLFLDDERSPEWTYQHGAPHTCYREPGSEDVNWVVVRSYDEFVEVIEAQGCPQFISFDHDLGMGPDGPAKSGMDCAKYLIEQELVPRDFRTHSANPVGAENVRSLMSQWIEHNQSQ